MNFGWIMQPPDWAVVFKTDIVDRLARIESTMATQADVDAIAAEIISVANAIRDEIAALEARVAAGASVDTTALRASVDALEAVATPPAA